MVDGWASNEIVSRNVSSATKLSSSAVSLRQCKYVITLDRLPAPILERRNASRRHWYIGVGPGADRNIFAAIHFIHCGNAFRARRNLAFPKDLSGLLIVCTHR